MWPSQPTARPVTLPCTPHAQWAGGADQRAGWFQALALCAVQVRAGVAAAQLGGRGGGWMQQGGGTLPRTLFAAQVSADCPSLVACLRASALRTPFPSQCVGGSLVFLAFARGERLFGGDAADFT